jgi:hypothetical protein
LLKPGMNAEVEVHVGRRDAVLAIPNAALRTQRDVGSAATVLGLDPDAVNRQLAQVRDSNGGSASLGGNTARDSAAGGGERRLPEGVTREQLDALFQKMRNGGPSALSTEERALLGRMRSSFGGQGGNRGGDGGRAGGQNAALFGGSYIVFVLKDGQPTPVNVRTGLTDLDYSEVRDGLAAGDTVLILPSASLVAQQEEQRERMSRMNQGLPGVQQQSTVPSTNAGRGR